MNLDAWETVWTCVALALLVLIVDGVLAARSGPGRSVQARNTHRAQRMAQLKKEKDQ